MQRLLILLMIIINNSTACVSLNDYTSNFSHKSLLNSKGYFDNPILYFSTKQNNKDGCETIVSLKSGKIIDSYPKKGDKEKICPDFNGYHEISLVDKVVYKNHLLAILVINEYSVSFADRGINPYFGYHLYVYRDKNGTLEKVPMFDKIGWGSGYKIGNQNTDNEELICHNRMPYTSKKTIETYLDFIDLKTALTRNSITPKTLTQYNDTAYYLQKAGANEEAIFLLEKIIQKFPNRTVAYINLGDAYWALGETEKARKAYTTYIEQMCNKGLQKKIPQEVLKRVERKDVCQ